MARRALWTGSISFGLVNIPIRLFSATQDRGIRFHLLHDQDKSRVQRKLVSATSGKEVHNEHLQRGFEIAKDQYVVMTEEELKGCAPEKSKAIEITDFVDLADIDPVYYDKPYYVAPQAAAIKPYGLLLEAMSKSKKVALAKFVWHEKEHLAALRPIGNVICLETMRFAEEIVDAGEIDTLPKNFAVSDRELKAAQQLIDTLSSEFNPSKYTDEYRDCIMQLVEKKSRGEEIHVEAAPEKKTTRGGDLMATLEASLAASSGKKKTNGNGKNGHAVNGNGKNGHALNGNGNGHNGNGHSKRRKSA